MDSDQRACYQGRANGDRATIRDWRFPDRNDRGAGRDPRLGGIDDLLQLTMGGVTDGRNEQGRCRLGCSSARIPGRTYRSRPSGNKGHSVVIRIP